MNSTKHFRVVIIGAGPAGIGAAIALSRLGIKSIALVERSDKIGGIPSLYKKKTGGVRTFIRWSRGGIPVFGEEYANSLKRKLAKTDVKIWLQSQVLEIEANEKKIILVNPVKGSVASSTTFSLFQSYSRE